jgi:very-short-patch-repair endonuclease
MNGVECIFAECYDNDKNNEHVFRSTPGPVYKLDFFVPSTKHIIEFDGTYWHNRNKESTSTISNRDRIRDNNIMSTDRDIKILHVKEADYRTNPERVIEQCLAFLKS